MARPILEIEDAFTADPEHGPLADKIVKFDQMGGRELIQELRQRGTSRDEWAAEYIEESMRGHIFPDQEGPKVCILLTPRGKFTDSIIAAVERRESGHHGAT